MSTQSSCRALKNVRLVLSGLAVADINRILSLLHHSTFAKVWIRFGIFFHVVRLYMYLRYKEKQLKASSRSSRPHLARS